MHWIILILLLISCVKEHADIVIKNGRIWTVEKAHQNQSALAIKDGKILGMGDDESILDFIDNNTTVLDAQGASILPGFIDSHVHLMDAGHGLSSVQLRDAKSKDEFIQRIQHYARTLKAGEWILNGDWNHENWGGELPNKSWIDSVTSRNPLFINRLDGHMALANSLALKLAQISNETENPSGGSIVRNQDNEPSGILKDNAMNFVYAVIPSYSVAQENNAYRMASDYLNQVGITSIHHMGSLSELAIFKRNKNQSSLRIYASIPLSQWKTLLTEQEKFVSDDLLKIGGLKGFMDGSLGSHTALMFDAFSDLPNDSGLQVVADDSIKHWIKMADANGLAINVHAIGDRAIHKLLNFYQESSRINGNRDRRFRIEHNQHIAERDISRLAELKIIASMQPYHCIDDGVWAEKIIGYQRALTSYAFHSLLDAGVTLAFGSDWFVAPPSPLWGIYAAVTRRTLDNKNPDGWIPEQKISLVESLIAYTINGAYAGFSENSVGSLTEGKRADVIILDRDIFKIDANEIKNCELITTIFNGKIVYSKK